MFVRELRDVKMREDSRVDAYILCGKLKTAYITAVKENLVSTVFQNVPLLVCLCVENSRVDAFLLC